MFKFSLSTVFLLGLSCALLFGWCADRARRDRRIDMLGVWVYPTADATVLGYGSRLEIRLDGTFTKTEMGRGCSEVFDGTYRFGEEGCVYFYATEMTTACPNSSTKTPIDAFYRCRCAIDPSGYLVMDVIIKSAPENVRMTWNTSMREP